MNLLYMKSSRGFVLPKSSIYHSYTDTDTRLWISAIMIYLNLATRYVIFLRPSKYLTVGRFKVVL